MAYDAKAQDFAYSFFARGWSKDRAVAEIKKTYPGFAGSTWDDWVARLGWRERRAEADLKLREFEDLAQNVAKSLLLQLDSLRKKLWARIEETGADAQSVYAYTNVTRNIADLARKHLADRDGGRLALEVLTAAFERFLTELREDAELAKALAAKAPLIGRTVERVAEEFGAEG